MMNKKVFVYVGVATITVLVALVLINGQVQQENAVYGTQSGTTTNVGTALGRTYGK